MGDDVAGLSVNIEQVDDMSSFFDKVYFTNPSTVTLSFPFCSFQYQLKANPSGILTANTVIGRIEERFGYGWPFFLSLPDARLSVLPWLRPSAAFSRVKHALERPVMDPKVPRR